MFAKNREKYKKIKMMVPKIPGKEVVLC
ncbi:MAG: hypothetical protein IJW61_02635 [Clostridia bacterium]|nr:hypothetical protein [Clostridia bacterium]